MNKKIKTKELPLICDLCEGRGECWTEIIQNEMPVDDGFEQCRICNGTGRVSKYDKSLEGPSMNKKII